MLILIGLQLLYAPRAPRYVLIHECSWDLQKAEFEWEQRVLNELHEMRMKFISEDCLSEADVTGVLNRERRISESKMLDQSKLYDVDYRGVPRKRVFRFEMRDYNKREYRSGLLGVNALGDIQECEHTQSRIMDRNMWRELREWARSIMKWK